MSFRSTTIPFQCFSRVLAANAEQSAMGKRRTHVKDQLLATLLFLAMCGAGLYGEFLARN